MILDPSGDKQRYFREILYPSGLRGTGIEMFGKEAKGRLTESGEQTPQKHTRAPKISAPRETEKEEGKVEDFAPEALGRVGQLELEPIDLPESYGETRVVLLAVDPWVLHVYWEVTAGELKKAQDKLGYKRGRSQAILRFYDITNTNLDGMNANNFFDVEVNLRDKKWYVHLWSPGKSYSVDLGFRAKDGQFVPLVRSNAAETPPAGLAPEAGARNGLLTVQESLGSVEHSSEEGEPQPQTPPPAPIDSADAPRRRPAKFSPERAGREPPRKPDVPYTGGSHSHRRKSSECDLAEMNEKRFTKGVSSKRPRSPRPKTGSGA
jgi:hypothetical protein